jgi:serine/threonine protein kinase
LKLETERLHQEIVVDSDQLATETEATSANLKADPKIVSPAHIAQCVQPVANAESVSPDPLVGTTIGGHFEIIEKLGEGGSGTVYRAKHLLLDKLVAIKFSRLELDWQRFQREAQAASLLDHPNLVRIFEFGLHDDKPFLVMELVEGRSLAQELSRSGRLSTLRATELALQICAALMHAHSKGVIHRDIKPSNIIISKDNEGKETVKVVDFGIAKILHRGDQPSSVQLTQTGETVGTPLYMSPEQCAGQQVDEQSDIYSLGCVLYEMVAGRPALTVDSVLAAMMAHVSEIKPDFNGLELPSHFQSVIQKCLRKDRVQRFESVAQLFRALARSSKDDLVAWLASLDQTLGREKITVQTRSSAFFKWLTTFVIGILVGMVIGIISLGFAFYAIVSGNYGNAPGDWQVDMQQAQQAIAGGKFAYALNCYDQAERTAALRSDKEHQIETLKAEAQFYKQHAMPIDAQRSEAWAKRLESH